VAVPSRVGATLGPAHAWFPGVAPGTDERGQTGRRPMDAPGMHDAAPARMLRGCLWETSQVSGRVGECAARDSNPEPAD
jgi:hypothetical protein